MSPECPEKGVGLAASWLSCGRRAGSAWSRARPRGRCGLRGTGCRTADRCRRRSGLRGPSAGRPPAGYHTKRIAESWLRSILDEACRGTLPGLVRTGATSADAAAEHLRYIGHDRLRKPSTLRGYRSAIEAHLVPTRASFSTSGSAGQPADEIARSAVAIPHLIRRSIWVAAGRARDDVTTSRGNHRSPG